MHSGWRHNWRPITDSGQVFDYLIKKDGVFDQWGNEITKKITVHDSMVDGSVVHNYPAGSLTGTVSLGEGHELITVMDGDSLEVTWEQVVVGLGTWEQVTWGQVVMGA